VDKPILLALSSFRQKDAQIQAALDLCASANAPLFALFVIDINLARYRVTPDMVVGKSLRQELEAGVMGEQETRARETLESVSALAQARGITCATAIRVGRFADEVRTVALGKSARSIVLTRADRPQWMRRLFGSPVDHICTELGERCNVIVV
jgi:nucleotide-binding universal stress UspA family protein